MMNTFKGLLEKYLDFIMHDRIVEYEELAYDFYGKLFDMRQDIKALEYEIAQLQQLLEEEELTIATLMEQLLEKQDSEFARRDAFDIFLDAFAKLEEQASYLIPLLRKE